MNSVYMTLDFSLEHVINSFFSYVVFKVLMLEW